MDACSHQYNPPAFRQQQNDQVSFITSEEENKLTGAFLSRHCADGGKRKSDTV